MNDLAINGGPNAIPEPLPSFRDHTGRTLGDEEIAELTETIRSGALSFLTGKKTGAFERGFADLLGVRDAVAVANGTAALHTALIYMNPEPGDEVILSPVTDIGSAIPIMAQLAIPVFADVCGFRRKRPPIPIESGHLFRLKAARSPSSTLVEGFRFRSGRQERSWRRRSCAWNLPSG
jgi:hypothetical protein